ncbi:MAG: penicillin-binding protein 2 [Bacteroidetes bacterium]|nr:penicillin-binding protein 2 [Bacteroidota bacterium]
MSRGFTARKYFILVLIAGIGSALLIRLFFIQVIADKYILSANNNVLRYITQYPARGFVYDRNGKLLVYNEAAYDLMVIPRQIRDFDTTGFCRLLGIDVQTFIEKVEKARKYSSYRPTIFFPQISKENYGFLEEKLFRFPGFYVQPRTLRKYPLAIAAHTVGYIGEVSPAMIERKPYYKSGDYIGISGIEKSYEEILRGKKGMKIRVVDVHNRDMGSFQEGKYDTLPVAGIGLWASLDADLQAYGELLMTNKKGSIVAIEPSSGEILALVTSPSYDPNLLVGQVRSRNYAMLARDTARIPLFNRALMAQYPPGSTFKIVNALIGLHEGILKPTTAFGCPGGFSLGSGKVVKCHAHFSPLQLKQSIQFSCNTYYCHAFRNIIDKGSRKSTRAGYEKWRKQVWDFGFGHKFETDLANELNGNIPSADYYDRFHGKNRWNSYSIISLAIGQGEIGVTPVQLANLCATIANRGFYYPPHIIRAIGKADSLNSKFLKKHVLNIEKEHFDLVVDAMEDVVLAGTATGARMDSISVCGKTGTAQNPHGKDHSIFIAFAPKDNPRIALCVIVENAGFGATWAAPIASLMIEKYLTRKIQRQDLETRMVEGNLLR